MKGFKYGGVTRPLFGLVNTLAAVFCTIRLRADTLSEERKELLYLIGVEMKHVFASRVQKLTQDIVIYFLNGRNMTHTGCWKMKVWKTEVWSNMFPISCKLETEMKGKDQVLDDIQLYCVVKLNPLQQANFQSSQSLLDWYSLKVLIPQRLFWARMNSDVTNHLQSDILKYKKWEKQRHQDRSLWYTRGQLRWFSQATNTVCNTFTRLWSLLFSTWCFIVTEAGTTREQ